jgi:hypothetical protein
MVYIHAYIYILCVYSICVYIYVYICVYIHAYMYMCIYVYRWFVACVQASGVPADLKGWMVGMSARVTKEAIQWRERKVEQVKRLGTHDDLFAASGRPLRIKRRR